MKQNRPMLYLVLMISVSEAMAAEQTETYTNRLIDSHNPYLLLHAHNPVDWYPWGSEALEKARRENKPIFISIGYSTCYWCHVAEREIYSNPQIAKLMNQWFVNIKVDREERPDLDQLYMLATQIITGHGGWPNNLFLTPDLKPFYAGSYFPPDDRNGRPGFPKILTGLHQAWENDHDRIEEIVARVYDRLQQVGLDAGLSGSSLPSVGQWLDKAVRESVAKFDEIEGGFANGSTKFPRSPQLSMLLAVGKRVPADQSLSMLSATLQAMAEGGIMDQLAGGFHRYSTEPGWSIPHFEKMLYDNTQLMELYAGSYALTKIPFYRQVALRTALFLMDEMQAPEGGFYSAQDAEVDGLEGASYVWTTKQIESLLGSADSERFFQLYSLIPLSEAPFGHETNPGSVLRLKVDEAGALLQSNKLAEAIEGLMPLNDKLMSVRRLRAQPLQDEKIVIADNALAIIAFSRSGVALADSKLTDVARKTAEWLWQRAFDPKTGDLKHQIFQDQASISGFLGDYALLGYACVILQRDSKNTLWQTRAHRLGDAMLKRFMSSDGRLATSWDKTNLLLTLPADSDSVKPSGASAAIVLLLEIAEFTHDQRYAIAARRALMHLNSQVSRNPSDWGFLLSTLENTALRAALVAAENSSLNARITFPSSADQVHAEARWVTESNESMLVVTVNVAQGYHINANPSSDRDLIATRLLIDHKPALNVDYPAPQLFKPPFAPNGIKVYEGRFTLKTQLPGAAALKKPEIGLRVQACNHEVCLAPANISVGVTGSGDRPYHKPPGKQSELSN